MTNFAERTTTYYATSHDLTRSFMGRSITHYALTTTTTTTIIRLLMLRNFLDVEFGYNIMTHVALNELSGSPWITGDENVFLQAVATPVCSQKVQSSSNVAIMMSNV